MNIRIAGIATVAAALLVAGWGDQNAPPQASTPNAATTSTAAPTAKASDEDQIRDVLTQEGAAFTAWNFDKVGEFTCPEFREKATSTDGAIPPMSMFPAAAAASIGPQKFADQIGAQFTGAS